MYILGLIGAFFIGALSGVMLMALCLAAKEE